MRQQIFILIFLLSMFNLFAQRDIRPISTKQDDEHTVLHASTTFGQDYFANKFFVNTFGVDYSKRLDNKTTLYFGANIFNINASKELIDRSPRKRNSGSMYMGISYNANDKLVIGGDIFYNGIYNMIGADLELKYHINDNNFLEIYASFSRQLSPSGNNQPIPYWYNTTFQPFIFGY
ncbi:MAG: hypothetical protein ACTTJH_02980 [Bacteroidales bacterium]